MVDQADLFFTLLFYLEDEEEKSVILHIFKHYWFWMNAVSCKDEEH